MVKDDCQQTDIGMRLRILRQALCLSQQELGDQLAVTACYLSMLENGLRQPSEHLLRLLCLTQNVNRNWLEAGVGEMLCRPQSKADDSRRDLQYRRPLMKTAIRLVGQAVREREQPFCVEEHCDLILNCYERLLWEESRRE